MKSLQLFFTVALFISLAQVVPAQSDYFMVDQSPIYVPEPEYQGIPSVAFNGTSYLAVWGDNRNAGSSVLMGSFIDQNGNVLNPAGKLLLESPGNKNEPVVIFDGSNFFIVWRDDKNGEDDIYGARFSSGGDLIGDEILISSAGGEEWGAEVTFDGTNYFVVWIDYRNGGADIYGARINQSGNLLDPNGIAICNAANDQEYPRVSAGASSFLVVWADYRIDSAGDYYGGRVGFDGMVLDPNGFIIQDGPDDNYFGDVEYDGTNWLVVWSQYPDLKGTRINSSGSVLDPGGLILAPPSCNAFYCSLEFDGTNYLVTWDTFEDDVRAARISTSATLLDPNGIDISVQNLYDEQFPAVTSGNGNFFITWKDDRNGGFRDDIYGARVTSGGTLQDTDGILLSISANKQTYPGCAFDGVNYLVAWEDNRNADTLKIYAALINQAGTLLSPGVFQLSNTPGNQRYPEVTFDGSNYLVVWSDERAGSDIYGTRVSTQGDILDPAGIQICTFSETQLLPSIASNGSQSFVVWVDYRSNPSEIWGARVDQSGSVLDPDGFQIYSGNFSGAGGIGVAYGSDSYLVVWASGGSNTFDIYGGRISSDGTLLDPGGFAISVAANNQDGPKVTFGGTKFLVVWMDNRNHQSEDDIYGARLSYDGLIIDPNGIPIATDTDYQQVPDIIFDRNQYIVSWFDKGDELNLKGANIDLSGNITDTYTISDQFGMQTYPSLAHGPEDQVLVIYQGFATDYNNASYNALRTWGTFLGLYVDVEDESSNIPEELLLHQNYPNPFNPSTKIRYTILAVQTGHAPYVQLKVYDVLGNEVATLVNEEKPAGEYEVEFNAKNLPSGIYFYQLRAGSFFQTKKMILLR
jgi:Secretion system C-terminal sorting domain